MKTDDAKVMVTVADELSESYVDLIQAIKDTTQGVKATKKLWRKGHNSRLIKVGLALIAFPDPTISDIIGSALVAAGTVQAGIRRHSIYVDDIFKTFQKTLREVRDTKSHI
jgi:hypothetical protein